MNKEFEKSHFASISANTIIGYQAYLKHLKAFFGEYVLNAIDSKTVEEYRDHRRQQPSIRYTGRTLKGATVNRELECLSCLLDLAVQRKYIPENPARVVKHFNELRERPEKQMLTLEQENRILKAAPPHLRVGIMSARANRRKNVQRRIPSTMGPSGLAESAHPLRERCQDTGILRASSTHGFGISCFAGMERTVWGRFALHLSKSAEARGAGWEREDDLAFDLAAGRCAAFSDLQLAARVLHTAKLGRSRCCNPTGYASFESGDETHLPAQHGRTSAGSDGKGERARVRRAPHGSLEPLYMTLI